MLVIDLLVIRVYIKFPIFYTALRGLSHSELSTRFSEKNTLARKEDFLGTCLLETRLDLVDSIDSPTFAVEKEGNIK